MEYTLSPGDASNYLIKLKFTNDHLKVFRQKALASFQKSLAEQGDSTLSLEEVAKKISPPHLEIGTMEEAIHFGTKELLKSNEDIKFIGNVYDLDKEDTQEGVIISFKLDVYPEVFISSEEWRQTDWSPLSAQEVIATAPEVEETLINLRNQFANNEASEALGEHSEFSLLVELVNQDELLINTYSHYIITEELAPEIWQALSFLVGARSKEPKTIKASSLDKKVLEYLFPEDDSDFSEEQLMIRFTVHNIIEKTLPQFNERNINRIFGNQEVKDEQELTQKISELVSAKKKEAMLMQWVDEKLKQLAPYFQIDIPKTLLEEEYKTRINSLYKRYDVTSEQALEEALKGRLSEMKPRILEAAGQSLKKILYPKKAHGRAGH